MSQQHHLPGFELQHEWEYKNKKAAKTPSRFEFTTKRLVISTSRVSYNGDDKLDITVKSGNNSILASSWDLVMGHKRGEITNDEYEARYLMMLRRRYQVNPQQYHDLLHDWMFRSGAVTLCCYCGHKQFCHRHLAAKVLQKIGASIGIEVIITGEIGSPTGQRATLERKPNEPTEAFEKRIQTFKLMNGRTRFTGHETKLTDEGIETITIRKLPYVEPVVYTIADIVAREGTSTITRNDQDGQYPLWQLDASLTNEHAGDPRIPDITDQFEFTGTQIEDGASDKRLSHEAWVSPGVVKRIVSKDAYMKAAKEKLVRDVNGNIRNGLMKKRGSHLEPLTVVDGVKHHSVLVLK